MHRMAQENEMDVSPQLVASYSAANVHGAAFCD